MNTDYDKLDDDTDCSEHSSGSSTATSPNDRVMCPICLERVSLTSNSSSSTTKPTLQLGNCGHLIHYLCLHKYVTSCVEAHVKKRIRRMNTFSLVEFRDFLASLCVTCPICRMDIRDSKKTTEVNDLCSVIFQNYERCLTESVNIDIRDERDNDDGSPDTRTDVDDGTASLITNNTYRYGYTINTRRCQGLFCGCGIIFLFMYSIVHVALESPQVQYYGPYNATT